MDPLAPGSFLDTAVALAITVTLWATGIGLGASVRASDIVAPLRRRGLLARVLALDLILVPVAMWVCVRVLVPDDGYATGLLLVAFASAGPLAMKLVGLARGNAALAIGLVVVLEVANLVVVPLWTSLLGVTSALVVIVDILRTLAILVLAPLVSGR